MNANDGELVVVPTSGRELADASFYRLNDVPPELEWFANIANAHTRRAYRNDVAGFMALFKMKEAGQFRQVTRSHLLAWRKHLETGGSGPATIRRKLSALASLFDHLCEVNAVTHNPVRGVKRPRAETGEGKTPAIADGQARKLLDAPPEGTLTGKPDRAIPAVLFFHGLRREELCKLRVKDVEQRQGVAHLRIHGKGEDKYDNVLIGMNSRLDTLQAAVLLEKLKIFPEEIAMRDRVASRYNRALAGVAARPPGVARGGGRGGEAPGGAPPPPPTIPSPCTARPPTATSLSPAGPCRCPTRPAPGS